MLGGFGFSWRERDPTASPGHRGGTGRGGRAPQATIPGLPRAVPAQAGLGPWGGPVTCGGHPGAARGVPGGPGGGRRASTGLCARAARGAAVLLTRLGWPMSRRESCRRPGRGRPPSWNSGLARPEGVPLQLLWDTGTVWGCSGHPRSSAPSSGDGSYPLWERRAALALRSTTPLPIPSPARASTASTAASTALPLPAGNNAGAWGRSGTSRPVPALPRAPSSWGHAWGEGTLPAAIPEISCSQ